MTSAAIVVAFVTVVFAVAGPQLAQRLPPAVAIRVLVPASLAISMCGIWVLGAVALTWAGTLGPVSRYGGWSPEQLRADSPFPMTLAFLCALLTTLAVGRLLTVGTRRLWNLLAVRRCCRRLGSPGSLIVIEHERPDAFATPGAAGRIVITTGLLRALTADQRRALIAHETSHIVRHHAWWLFGAALTSAANPMMTPMSRAVAHLVERWADEDAAREVTDRRLVAETVAHAALLTRHREPGWRPSAAPAATGGDMPKRVRALLEPPQQPRVGPLVLLAVLLAASLVATGTMQTRSETLFDNASACGICHR
ncbi:MAG TPA: M56 family metallopeptidase [Rugosimonospora sp.]|nr:M56 family metallopeptidase [Rugosimonospora sp.]